MVVSYSPFWTIFFIFQLFLNLCGIFSQLMFMKTTAWDKKIEFNCRVYLFFLSLGYQMMLVAFMGSSLACLYSTGSIFVLPECSQVVVPFYRLRNFGGFLIVVFHLLVNIDRLDLASRPGISRGRAAKVYFYVSCLVAIAISAIYTESVEHGGILMYIGLGCITSVNVLNVLVILFDSIFDIISQVEVKIFFYTNSVYKNTLGRVPLERRFELSTSVTMVRCFLPASISSLIARFVGILLFFLIFNWQGLGDIMPIIFVMSLFFNLECILFSCVFIILHPTERKKLKRILRVKPRPALHDQKKSAPQAQQEHFDSFKVLWKVEI